MEIGRPTNVRHVAHVTFDRFNGFLGLPVEFEPEVPRRAPSASASVFGVSTESMQCSYDSRGNSVPTILLLMQRRLYCLGGLQSEGIFRINAENGKEEYARDYLNRGIVPDGIDVHCLAGLIKAWFRELPTGVLDSLSPEHVMLCQSEEECAQLVRLLPTTEAALLDWAINLMADVAQEEHHNKMNARNVARVFAPNMTQMDDPLSALMYAVQVIHFLKMLIVRTLRERQDVIPNTASASHSESSDKNDRQRSKLRHVANVNKELEHGLVSDEPASDGDANEGNANDGTEETSPNLPDKAVLSASYLEDMHCDLAQGSDANTRKDSQQIGIQSSLRKNKSGQWSKSNQTTVLRRIDGQKVVWVVSSIVKAKGVNHVTCVNPKAERVAAWRSSLVNFI